MPSSAFVVGQWVRGGKFYGRAALLDEILEGPRNSIWLLGTRRVGKTSVLKQLEYLTADPENSRFCPLFWDFQGAEDLQELHEGFVDSLWDAEDRLDPLGVKPGEPRCTTEAPLRMGIPLSGVVYRRRVSVSSLGIKCNPHSLARIKEAMCSSYKHHV